MPEADRFGRQQRTRGWGSVAVLCGAMAATAWGGGNQSSTCATLCPGLPDPCVVNGNKTIVAGSVLDCGTRQVQVTNGDVLIHDGGTVLKAGSLLVQRDTSSGTNHAIVADCPQATGASSIQLELTGALTIGTGGKLVASCDEGGGEIVADVGGAATLGGSGIRSDGSGPSAPGGTVIVRAEGALTTSAAITATTTATTGDAAGGAVVLSGSSVTVGADIDVHGVGTLGSGSIGLDSEGALAITAGTLDAGTTGGGAGTISATAKGALTVARPCRAKGTVGGSRGGTIELEGASVDVTNDLIATGAAAGGEIRIEAHRGTVTLGTTSSGGFDIDVSATGTTGGLAGLITAQSGGNTVTVGGNAHVKALNSSGQGGSITIQGVAVTTASGSQLYADGASTNNGGRIVLTTLDAMNLQGDARATNGAIELVYRATAPTVGSGVIAPVEQRQVAALPAPCGDHWLGTGVETCDPYDFNGQSCGSLGHGSGTLACNSTCTGWDYSGCY